MQTFVRVVCFTNKVNTMAGITERQIKKWGFTLPPGGLAALTPSEINELDKLQADTKYYPPEGALARLRASPTKPVDNITRGSVKKEKVTESSEEQPRSIAAAKRLYKKTGDNKYLFYQHDTGKTDVKGKPIYKKMAAVYKEDLKGLSLTEYLNKKMNLKPRTRKAPPLPKRKPRVKDVNVFRAKGGLQSKKRTGHADFRKGGLFY